MKMPTPNIQGTMKAKNKIVSNDLKTFMLQSSSPERLSTK